MGRHAKTAILVQLPVELASSLTIEAARKGISRTELMRRKLAGTDVS